MNNKNGWSFILVPLSIVVGWLLVAVRLAISQVILKKESRQLWLYVFQCFSFKCGLNMTIDPRGEMARTYSYAYSQNDAALNIPLLCIDLDWKLDMTRQKQPLDTWTV